MSDPNVEHACEYLDSRGDDAALAISKCIMLMDPDRAAETLEDFQRFARVALGLIEGDG